MAKFRFLANFRFLTLLKEEMLSHVNNGINTFDRRWSLWSDIFAEIQTNVLIVKQRSYQDL